MIKVKSKFQVSSYYIINNLLFTLHTKSDFMRAETVFLLAWALKIALHQQIIGESLKLTRYF